MVVESKAAAAGVLCAECALVSCCASGRLLSKCMRCSSKQQEGEGVVHSIEQPGVQQASSLVVCEKEKNCAYACSHHGKSVNSMWQGACICWPIFSFTHNELGSAGTSGKARSCKAATGLGSQGVQDG